MYKLIQRNKKKMMAVFAAGLMVAFALQANMFNGPGGGDPGSVAYGRMGDRTISRGEVAAARQDWEMLSQYGATLGPILTMQFKEHPDFYYLLQERAKAEGIAIPQERVTAIMSRDLPPRVPRQQMERAVRGFLLVQSYLDRLGSNIKVSEPHVRRAYSGLQEITLNLVELKADDFKPAGPLADEELKAHFEKSVQAATSKPADASLTFDYEFPDRIKYQYLSFGPEELRKVVRKQQEDYQWEVAAIKYFRNHKNEFTPPATNESDAPASQPSTTQATTKPDEKKELTFDQVKDQALAKVMAPAVAQLSAELSEKIAARLGANGSSATTQGAATQPADFASFAYLERMASEIEKEFGIRPTVVSKANEWTDVSKLFQVAGLGSASAGDQSVTEIAQQVEALAGPSAAGRLVKLNQFNGPLRNHEGNVYFFRVTEAEKKHYPKSFADVRKQVEDDLRTLRGYEKAKEMASRLLGASRLQGLFTAAASDKRKVITIGPFTSDVMSREGMFQPIPGYEAADFSTKSAVAGQGLRLLGAATTDNPHPRELVEVPGEHKVIVMELASASSRYKNDMAYRASVQIASTLMNQKSQMLAAELLSYDELKKQLDFHPSRDAAESAD